MINLKDLRVAFTLAEVLITLGIIGVVAALTLPPLIQNHNKLVWVNQLKKSVNTLENGFKLAMAEDGADRLQDTALWQSIGSCDGNVSNTNCNDFFNNFKKYFNVIYEPNKSIAISSLSNNSILETLREDILLSDSIAFQFSQLRSTTSTYDNYGPHRNLAPIVIDVNGNKKPNKLGRDVFIVGLTEQGQIIPHGSKTACKLFCELVVNFPPVDADVARCTEGYYESNSWKSNVGYGSCNTEGGSGRYCAARIIENGWKMDY